MKTIIIGIEKALIEKRKRLGKNRQSLADKERYLDLKENGTCTSCRKRPALKPHTKCRRCFYIDRNRELKKKENLISAIVSSNKTILF